MSVVKQLEIKVKADGFRLLNKAIGGTQADVDAMVELVELAMPSPQKALAQLMATDPGVAYPATIVTWIEGKHIDVLHRQICTIDQAKQLVALGCSVDGPTLAWWREYQPWAEKGDAPAPPQQFAQIAKWWRIEKARKLVPDKFFPAFTADELWAMFPPVSGSGPAWYAGPGRNGGWYCHQLMGQSFKAPTQAQAVAEMLIYLLKNKAKYYVEDNSNRPGGYGYYIEDDVDRRTTDDYSDDIDTEE